MRAFAKTHYDVLSVSACGCEFVAGGLVFDVWCMLLCCIACLFCTDVFVRLRECLYAWVGCVRCVLCAYVRAACVSFAESCRLLPLGRSDFRIAMRSGQPDQPIELRPTRKGDGVRGTKHAQSGERVCFYAIVSEPVRVH